MRKKGCHRVLFVDDEQNVIEGLRDALNKESYVFLSANSARHALMILEQQEVDVVVSDEKMPGMSGIEFLNEVRVHYPETVRIVLTGHASLDMAMRAINEGEIYRLLVKPCHPRLLAITIRHALAIKDLANQSTRLLHVAKKQHSLIQKMEIEHPGITRVRKTSRGSIVVDDTESDLVKLTQQLKEELDRLDSHWTAQVEPA